MPSYSDIVTDAANKLANREFDLQESESYYEASYRVKTIGISTPPEMRCLRADIGWARMYLDSLEERMNLESFRLADHADLMKRLLEWWQANDLDEESGLAHLDAFIYGRSYITIAAPGEDDDPTTPIIRVESPLSMWAESDPRTRKVTQAVRLYKNPDNHAEKWATLYLPDKTVYLKNNQAKWIVDPDIPTVEHKLGVVPVVPMVNRARLADREGRSEIIPELRSFIDAASRTMMNAQAAAELMALPQRVLFGVDANELAPGGTPGEVMKAYMAQYIAVGNDAGKAEQFDAAELRNYVDILQEIAKHVASYTGLPPQYLTFSSDNPASAEAIKSSESRLVTKCERKSKMFGGSWEEVMRIAVRIMDGTAPVEMSRLQSVWADPSTPTYASLADGVQKIYANGQGPIPKRRARLDLGYTDEEIDEMTEWDEEDKAEMIKLADVLGQQQTKHTAASKPAEDDSKPDERGTVTKTSTESKS